LSVLPVERKALMSTGAIGRKYRRGRAGDFADTGRREGSVLPFRIALR
jgi:hypothetical protein